MTIRTSYEVDTTSWPPEGLTELHQIATRLSNAYGSAVAVSKADPELVDETDGEMESAMISQRTCELLLSVMEKMGGNAQAAVIRKAMQTGEPVARAEALSLLGKGPGDKLPKFRSKVIAAVKELQSRGLLDESIDPKYGVMTVDYGKGVQALSFYLGEALLSLRQRKVDEGQL